jgi:hypothetical protein
MENKCLFLEGCGLINYIFIVVFLLLTHSTYLLSSVIEDLLFILNVIQFFVLIAFACYQRTKIHLFPVIYYKSEINTLDIEYKSSLLRGNG